MTRDVVDFEPDLHDATRGARIGGVDEDGEPEVGPTCGAVPASDGDVLALGLEPDGCAARVAGTAAVRDEHGTAGLEALGRRPVHSASTCLDRLLSALIRHVAILTLIAKRERNRTINRFDAAQDAG